MLPKRINGSVTSQAKQPGSETGRFAKVPQRAEYFDPDILLCVLCRWAEDSEQIPAGAIAETGVERFECSAVTGLAAEDQHLVADLQDSAPAFESLRFPFSY